MPGPPPGPRYRSLKPTVWQVESVGEVSLAARLLYVGLITQADDEGRQSAHPALIASRVYPYDGAASLEQIPAWLGELQAAHLIRLYEADGRAYLLVEDWSELQRIPKPSASRIPAPPATPQNVPESSTKAPERSSAAPSPVENVPPVVEGKVREGRGVSVDPAMADPDVLRLSNLLAELIRERDPKAKVAPDSARWLTSIDRLLRLDERPASEVESVIRWAQADTFWRNNILSPDKLREQYSRLRGQSLESTLENDEAPHVPAIDGGPDIDAGQLKRAERQLASLEDTGYLEPQLAVVLERAGIEYDKALVTCR